MARLIRAEGLTEPQAVQMDKLQTASGHLLQVIDAILDAPMVEGQVGDSDEFYTDLQALEEAQSTMKVHGADIQTVTSNFFAEFSALDFGGDD